MNRKMVGQYTLRMIGLILFVVIIANTDFTGVGYILTNINLLYLIALVVLVLPIMLLKGFRWYVIANSLGMNLKPDEATTGLCIAQMTGLTLPGALGDLIRIPFLKCRGNPSDKSILSLFLDAIAASIVPYSVSIIAMIEFFNLDVSLIVAVVFFGLLFVIGVYGIFKIIMFIIGPWMYQARLRRIQRGGALGRIVFQTRDSIRFIGLPSFFLATLLSGLAWLVYSMQGWLLARVLQLDVTWYHIALALTLTSLITALPISIQGVGIREGVLLFILSTLLGLEASSVVVFAIALTLISLTPAAWGIISWIRDPFVRLEPEHVEDAITQPIEVFLNLSNSEFEISHNT